MVIQPLAAVWVEKLDKKKVMIITDILRGLLVTVLAITYVLDVLTPWMLAVLALAISSAESFRIPAGIGFIPRIINMDYYSFGSGLNRTVSTVMELIGTGLSGIILGVFGIPAAVGIDMLSTLYLPGSSALSIPLIPKVLKTHVKLTAKPKCLSKKHPEQIPWLYGGRIIKSL